MAELSTHSVTKTLSQNEYHAELYSRNLDFWKYQVYTQPDQPVVFEPLEFEIALGDIYENVAL